LLWTDKLGIAAGNNYFDKIACEIQKWALAAFVYQEAYSEM